MSRSIERHGGLSGTFSLVATTPTSSTTKIPFGAVAGGVLFVTAHSSATKLQWYAAVDVFATPVPLYSDGAVVETTALANNRAYPIPDAAFGAPFLVAATDTGTATVQIYVKT